MYIEVDSLVIPQSDLDHLRAIAVLADNESIAAAFDGPVEVTDRQVALHKRECVIMVGNGDGGLKGFARDGIGHDAVNAIEALVHVKEKRSFVIVPEVGELVGVRHFQIRTLDGQLTALRIAVHVVLAATADHIPSGSVGDAVVVVVHVVRVEFVTLVGIFVTDELVPCVIGMERVGVIPRIVHHLGAAMVVGAHYKGIILCELHKPLGFGLIVVAVGVGGAMWVSVIAVHVDAVGVATCGSAHVVVPCMIGAVGVGQGPDVKVNIVDHILHLRLVGVFQQIVNETEHENPACGLVAVDGARVEELGFAIGRAVVEVGNQDFAAAGQCTEGDDFAFVRMVSLEGKHHVFVCAIGGVAVPVVFGTVAAVPHGHFFKQRRRRLKRHFIAELLKLGEIFVVGVGGYQVPFNAVHRNGVGDGLEVIVAIQVKGKIILITLLHELMELFLAFLSKDTAANNNGEHEDKIA